MPKTVALHAKYQGCWKGAAFCPLCLTTAALHAAMYQRCAAVSESMLPKDRCAAVILGHVFGLGREMPGPMQLCCLVVPPAAWTAGAACLLYRDADRLWCRAHVVAAVPSLRQLDGRAVTPEERHQAAMALRHEETVMALMLSNACLVHKLVGAEQGLPHAQAFGCLAT